MFDPDGCSGPTDEWQAWNLVAGAVRAARAGLEHAHGDALVVPGLRMRARVRRRQPARADSLDHRRASRRRLLRDLVCGTRVECGSIAGGARSAPANG